MPWPSAWPKAASTRSATRDEVSTLPAATAAGGRALSRLPSGAITRERAVGALARRHVGVGEHAQGEVAGRQRHGERAVEVAVVLGGRAGEVEHDPLAVHRRAAAAARRSPSARLEHVARRAHAVVELGDARARAPLGVVERLLEPGAEAVQPEALDQRLHALARRRGRRPAGRAGRPRAGAGCASGRPARAALSSSSRGGRRSPRPRRRASASRPACCRARAAPTSAWWARLAAKPDQLAAVEERARSR